MFKKVLSILSLFFLISFQASAGGEEIFSSSDFELEIADFFVQGIESDVYLICKDEKKLFQVNYEVRAVINGKPEILRFENNQAIFQVSFDRKEPFSIKVGGYTAVKPIDPMPLWLSIIPPLLVIVLALAFKEVVSSLILGILSGGVFIGYYTSSDSAANAFWRLTDTYVVESLANPDHVAIILMSLMIGAIVAIISRNGGMLAVVNAVSKKAKTARGGQFATWFMGIAIFFDDYANTLVVGNTMRPMTDSLRISREKLSYIVDSTAAPVAAIALVTTWIGAELGYIEGALGLINSSELVVDASAYGVFLSSLQFAFYPFLCLAFIAMLIWTNRDFGPMLAFERRARKEGVGGLDSGKGVSNDEFEVAQGVRPKIYNALIPILVIVVGTMLGLFATGYSGEVWLDSNISFSKKLALIVGASDSYKALIWSSSAALATAVLLTAVQRVLTLPEIVDSMVAGFKSLLHALVIVTLAWSLAAVTESMYTADFIASLVQGKFAYWLLPGITFLISAAVAFSTGSSWGSMAIVYPLFLPLSWELSVMAGLSPAESLPIFCNVASCVLAGAVLGDHCSPISDTTILSSLATQCNHVDHVRTQMPYALTVGGVAIVLTTLAALGIPSLLLFILGLLALYGVIRLFGKKVDDLI